MCGSANTLYAHNTYGIDHITEKARDDLQRDGRINGVFDSEKEHKYVPLVGNILFILL
jgi:hypothetical protein